VSPNPELDLLRQIARDTEELLTTVAIGDPALQARLQAALAKWRQAHP
jgi:arginine/ornithine N-succinyltransferase beta subunit